MSTTKKGNGTNSSNGNGSEKMVLLDVNKAEPVNLPCMSLVGARCVGKNTILEALTGLDDSFYPVEYEAALREPRVGEARAVEPGVKIRTLAELEQDPRAFVFGYIEENVAYVFPQENFDGKRVPIFQIVGRHGLEKLQEHNTLPYKLNIHITTNPSAREDLEDRIINRLVQTKEFPTNFQKKAASHEQLARITERLIYTKQSIQYFAMQTTTPYDAIFYNNNLAEVDPQNYLYNEKPITIVTTNIARRIIELYGRWKKQVIGAKKPVSIEEVHYNYATDTCMTLFGKGTKKLQPGNRLASSVRNAILEYAAKRGIAPEPLYDFIKNVRIEYIEKNAGRYSVFLRPIDKQTPIYVAEILHKTESRDFDVLGVLAERICQRYGTRPHFEVIDGIVKGARWSLSDEKVGDANEGKHHELFIGFR